MSEGAVPVRHETDDDPSSDGSARPTALEAFVAEARSHLDRIEVATFDRVVADGALVVDVRPFEIRQAQGELDAAVVIGLNVLEWRLAPSSPHRTIDVDPARTVVVVCAQGFSSSLAARRLQLVGLAGATDLVGGFEALVAHRAAS